MTKRPEKWAYKLADDGIILDIVTDKTKKTKTAARL